MKTFEERMKETYAIAAKEIEEEKMFKGYKIVKKNKIAEFGKKALIWCYDNRTMIWASIAGSMMGLNIALNKENNAIKKEFDRMYYDIIPNEFSNCPDLDMSKSVTLACCGGEKYNVIENLELLKHDLALNVDLNKSSITGVIVAAPRKESK